LPASSCGSSSPRRPTRTPSRPSRKGPSVSSPSGAGAAPVTFLLDYDGTIALTDISDAILAAHARDPRWKARDEPYDAGLIGSRDLLAWDATILPDDEALLTATAEQQRQDHSFPAFAATVRRWGASIEVVSDGFGFYVAPMLAQLGVGELPVATAEMRFGTGAGHPEIAFPAGHPSCFVGGTCKRERVRAAHRQDHLVAYVGDGMSDRYGAAHAEVIFAKARLARLCDEEGWPYLAWERFAEIERWTEEAFRAGALPRDRTELAEARRRLVEARWPGESVAIHPEDRHFVCGPEVWGPGRHDPVPPPDVTA